MTKRVPNDLNKLKFPRLFKITMNTKLYDEHEDQSPKKLLQNSKVSLVPKALPGLIYRHPVGENSSFHSKTKVQTVLMSACFENALILKITLGKIIVSHQNDNLIPHSHQKLSCLKSGVSA